MSPSGAISILTISLVLASAHTWVHGEPTTTMRPAQAPVFREADEGTSDEPATTVVPDDLAADERAILEKANSRVRPAHAVNSDARLMREFRDIRRSYNCKRGVLSAELVDEDLYEWQVKLTFNGTETMLREDLSMFEGQEADYLMLHISYGHDYPNSPPFVRVAHPIIKGGFVHAGGAICMELLTRQGWIPECTSEALILSIQAQLLDGDARVNDEPSAKEVDEYFSDKRAKERFAQMERDHGWHKKQ